MSDDSKRRPAGALFLLVQLYRRTFAGPAGTFKLEADQSPSS
jgi:hypothetical protein